MAKKEIKLTIKVGEVFYDIANKTYLAGRTAMEGDKYKEAADAVTDNSAECENELYRNIQSCIGLLCVHLGKYIKAYNKAEDVSNVLKNNLLKTGEKGYVLVFSVPNNFNHSSVDFIATSIHDYIVNYCIGNWYLKTNKEEADSYYKMANSLLPLIYEAMSKRVRRKRGDAF